MKIEVNYLIFNRSGNDYVAENVNRSTIIEVAFSENEVEMDKLIQSELSSDINRPINEFKVLSRRRIL
ncbi:hypothetical protein COJ46_01405 [Bacillus sp. AFS077874]|uniref:hypothetical protein n=1 Tax=unclassified Bacillus (in: firmicutes) TaxID=185979 RepID=UPI000BEC7FFB|nr:MULTISPECIES: hypothetical protein [unclassified Bacillus (in: firmicutes)]PEC50908.1 hypothetical protein CON00_04120 [Bacillus sp. AFS096315]PFM83204.1 hypothetical protein COJ46_01405 [Bacillus sp. AFS077874]